MNIVTAIAVSLLFLLLFVLGGAGALETVWREFARRRASLAVLAALAAFCAILAQKGSTYNISFDAFIADAGSYATNDVLHVAATNSGSYAQFDFADCDLLVYRRQHGQTNATDWAECTPRRKFGDLPCDYTVPNATNYNYLVVVDYVPPSPVHTNGVFEMRGFVLATTPSKRSAAFSNSAFYPIEEIVLPPATRLSVIIPDNSRTFGIASITLADGSDSASIDWGDGSEPTVVNADTSQLTHAYASGGRYTITLSDDVYYIAISTSRTPAVYLDTYAPMVERVISTAEKLTNIPSRAFKGATQLVEARFKSVRTLPTPNAANAQFVGCDALLEIHFAAENENAIKATTSWTRTSGTLGATNATIYFDL